MNILKMAKEQRQKDIENVAERIERTRSDTKRLEEKVAKTALTDAMDSVEIPPADDFTPHDRERWDETLDDCTRPSKPPVEKTPEEQEGIAILDSLPETMRPAKFRQIHVDIKAEALKQKAALEKVQAKITDAVNHCDDMIKCSELSLGVMDGKPAAKPTPPKKPATTSKRKGRPPKNTPPIAENVEEKKTKTETGE